MSFVIQAPYPLLQSTLLLPSPREGNQKNLAATVETMRSMNGKLYTYIKAKRGRKALQGGCGLRGCLRWGAGPHHRP